MRSGAERPRSVNENRRRVYLGAQVTDQAYTMCIFFIYHHNHLPIPSDINY